MSSDDGHGPKYGCNLNVCGNPTAESLCPFGPPAPAPAALDNHHHEYMLVCSCGDVKPITPSTRQHGIIGVRNRGERWMD